MYFVNRYPTLKYLEWVILPDKDQLFYGGTASCATCRKESHYWSLLTEGCYFCSEECLEYFWAGFDIANMREYQEINLVYKALHKFREVFDIIEKDNIYKKGEGGVREYLANNIYALQRFLERKNNIK